MASPLLTYAQLIELHPQGLKVDAYQRGYVWGQQRQVGKDAVTYLTECLLDAFHCGNEYFLQGITTDANSLIDGQQRLTYMALLVRWLGGKPMPLIFEGRDSSTRYLIEGDDSCDYDADPDTSMMHRTQQIAKALVDQRGVGHADFLQYVLHKVTFLCINLPDGSDPVALYTMMNAAKSPMLTPDLIKADIMRLASDNSQPYASIWQLEAIRSRYGNEWEAWVRWWNRDDVRNYFETTSDKHPLDLLLKLAFRSDNDTSFESLTFDEYQLALKLDKSQPWQSAKHIFTHLRNTQRRFEQAWNNAATYNQLRAILLLQRPEQKLCFQRKYFVSQSIDNERLLHIYRMSFLGMTFSEIEAGDDYTPRFDNVLATLSLADVYHGEGKREAFKLLLRLNIDEDTKLNRKFDFSIWSNRSLEHIYSKSCVWHTDPQGRIVDGNDSPIRGGRSAVTTNKAFMPRSIIVNRDGTQLSEHCIGNLVLLYGKNNAAFGNASFSRKKEMFLTPGDATVFHSRNLLHSVCVFAGNHWNEKSIVENYNNILKNFKLYYDNL